MNQALDRRTDREQSLQLDAEDALIEAALDDIYGLLREGVLSIGGVDGASKIAGLNRGDLDKILKRTHTERRGLVIDDLLAIARRILHKNPTLGLRIGAALVTALDLQVFPRTSLKDGERGDLLAAHILSMPLGKQLLAEALGGFAILDDKTRADKLEAFLRSMALGDQLVEYVLGGRR